MTNATTAGTSVQTGQIRFLDGMRGLAALYVMIGHARYLLWEGYAAYKEHPAAYSRAGKLLVYFFSAFRYGHEAVMFFFVLSGFVIHLKYARRISRQPNTPFDFKDYLKRRAERLYPPLLFALLLTFLLDSYGSRLGYHVYQGGTPYAAINQVGKDHSLLTLLGNVCWLQRTVVPEFGSDGPLWSLMYEWWFYMLYPVFFYINRRSMPLGLLAAVALCGCSLALPYVQVVTPVLQAFLLWYLGVVVADIYAGRLALTSLLPAAGILLLPFVLVMEEKIKNAFVSDLLVAVAFSCMLYTSQRLFKKGWRFSLLNRLQWLGDCSYTLYITHFPLLFFFSGWLMQKYSGYLPVTQWYVMAGILCALVFAYLVHFVVEKPFTRKKLAVQTKAAALVPEING